MHNLDIFLPEAGFLALLLSLGVNVLTPLATWCGMGQHWRGVMRLTTCGAWMAFTLLLLAFAILVSCFLTSDFSVVYVAQHSHSQLSWGLKLAAVWGGHEGSLLLWALLLSGWTALFAWRSRHESDALFPLTLSILSSLWLRCCYLLCCGPIRSCVFSLPPWKGATLIPCCNIWG